MYNRYIPSANGGYVCQKIAEPPAPQRFVPPSPEPEPEPAAPSGPACAPPGRKGGLLQRLLPRGIELDDLLILLILLQLMLDSDEDEDSLTVLLAVAAFLILQ